MPLVRVPLCSSLVGGGRWDHWLLDAYIAWPGCRIHRCSNGTAALGVLIAGLFWSTWSPRAGVPEWSSIRGPQGSGSHRLQSRWFSDLRHLLPMAHGESLVGPHSTSLCACVCACAGPWADVHSRAPGGRGGSMLSTKQGYVRHTAVDMVVPGYSGGPPWGPRVVVHLGAPQGFSRPSGGVGLGGVGGQLSNMVVFS